MKSEEMIDTQLEILKHDVECSDLSKRDYCRFYAMIEILEWVLEEE